MATAIDRIRSKNKPVAKIESSMPVSVSLPTAAFQPERSTTVEDHPQQPTSAAWPHSTIPPPIPCPICDCPAIWSSIYEPTIFRCCDCDPPPGGKDAWHWQRGGWAFVARRIEIVAGEWESFQRLGDEINLSAHPSSRSSQQSTDPTSQPPGGIIYMPPIENRSSRGWHTRPSAPCQPPYVPPEIIDTRRKCPRCEKRFVLAELRTITGGELCWTCWQRSQVRSAAA